MSNEYLKMVIANNQQGLSPAKIIINNLGATISQWGGHNLREITIAGSNAKGTGIKGSTDVDLFISFKASTPDSLEQIFNNLYFKMAQLGFNPKRQNVSIGITYNGHSVDLVPGKQQSGYIDYHSIFKSKTRTWTQTNIQAHINKVKQSGRANEIQLTKIWRNLNHLDFPSFLLELTVIEALKSRGSTDLTGNFSAILLYLKHNFANSRIVDPANSNNIISDDLTLNEKLQIALCASLSLNKNWSQVVR
jgi:hypothetical protein